MRAGKAYISSLGTTGVLIASSLLMLAVVGALVAFDRWPDHADANTPLVQIAGERPARGEGPGPTQAAAAPESRRDGSRTGGRDRRASRAADRAAGSPASRGDSLRKARPVADPVISELPAPDAAASPRPRASAPEAPTAPEAPAPEQPSLPVVGEVDDVLSGGDPTDGGAGGLESLSPAVGGTLRESASAVDGTVAGLTASTDG